MLPLTQCIYLPFIRHQQCEKYQARHWQCRYELVMAPSFKAAHSQVGGMNQNDLGKPEISPQKVLKIRMNERNVFYSTNKHDEECILYSHILTHLPPSLTTLLLQVFITCIWKNPNVVETQPTFYVAYMPAPQTSMTVCLTYCITIC